MIPYGRQSVGEDDIKAVIKVLHSDFLTQGPKVNEFERALAEYCGSRYAVVLSSGTAALHGAYYSAGLEKGDEFITSPLTFVATANAGLYLGARPIFADCDTLGNLDPKEAEKKITSKTKLISVVDYTGNPADLGAFKKIARKYRLVLVEDACQAFGAEYKGKKIGSISDMTVFSFHPVKSITTGEGGAVLTNDKNYYEKLLLFRNHGITKDSTKLKYPSSGRWYFEMQELGYNYRLTDIQAALGISQLRKIGKFLEARKLIVNRYNAALALLKDFIEIPQETKRAHSAWHLYVVRLRGELITKRAYIFNTIREKGIGVQVHHVPVHFQPYYKALGYRKGLCPKAEAFYESCFSLPIFPSLSVKDQKTVVNTLTQVIHSI